jgi:uncharacterized DUF497 family protein
LAVRVFLDPLARTEHDRIEDGERRWRTVGLVDGVLLLVAHTIEDDRNSEVIRLISARRAKPKERRRYEQENR